MDYREPFFRAKWPIRVRNVSGELIPPGAIMRPTGDTEEDGEIVITVGKPDTTFRREYLVNGPIAIGVESTDEGWASKLSEAGLVLLESGTPALHEEWGPSDDSWALTQHRPGFLMQGEEVISVGQYRFAIAKQVLTTSVFVKADESIANGATGAVRVQGGTPGSETDTGQTIADAFNPNSLTADEDDPGTVTWLHGKPYLFPIC